MYSFKSVSQFLHDINNSEHFSTRPVFEVLVCDQKCLFLLKKTYFVLHASKFFIGLIQELLTNGGGNGDTSFISLSFVVTLSVIESATSF